MKSKGYVIHKGPSPIDGKPIVCIATFGSQNRKTGPMVQVWILCEDIDPVSAVTDSTDYSICGDCKHRYQDGKRTCYVNVGQAPLSVWRAYKRGRYENLPSIDVFKGTSVRFGAYGDPALLPASIVHAILSVCTNHTGYTHQWQEERGQWARGIFQASVDSNGEAHHARLLGWRTFQVVSKGTTPTQGTQCPATIDASQAQCITCKLCNGGKRDVFVEVHGPQANKFIQG